MTMMHDPVHGPLTLRGWRGQDDDLLLWAARSPALERLRRVKQLGFAAYAFPSADHSRYAHALGTMHVMRRLLDGHSESLFRGFDVDLVRQHFPVLGGFVQDDTDLHGLLASHLLLGALVQDIGELPYAHATFDLIRPDGFVWSKVFDKTGLIIDTWDAKEAFTAGYLCEEDGWESRRVDIQFLFFLLFRDGCDRPETRAVPEFRRLRHLLDGVVDADRLDYVYRDAHHTVGHLGGPQAVIDSLAYVDELGPVFSEPGPVLDFFSTRASVHSRVYYSAQHRFRIALLRTIFRSLESSEIRSLFFEDIDEDSVSIDEFLTIDDEFVQAGLERLASERRIRSLLPKTERGRAAFHALGHLHDGVEQYETEWLPPSPETVGGKSVALPDQLFFDTCPDLGHHRLYDKGSVRIEGPRFRRFGRSVALEDCAGPLRGMLDLEWFPLAKRHSILLFMPAERNSVAWRRFNAALDAGTAYPQLQATNPALRIKVTDTRDCRGFTGPAIFISYAFAIDDRHVVERVAHHLWASRRRYFIYTGPLDGTGMTAQANSIGGVQDAEAVLVVLSAKYREQRALLPDGNISKELYALRDRVRGDFGFPFAFVSADDHDEVEKALAWEELGLASAPLTFPLRTASPERLAEAVDRAVGQIDERCR